jgi:hypothetical protein
MMVRRGCIVRAVSCRRLDRVSNRVHVLARADNGVTSYPTKVKVRSELKFNNEEKRQMYRIAGRRWT